MNTYILLFRGINVGGKNILPMKELKSHLEESGFESVKTYIQSGNVVLKASSKPSVDLAKGVEAKFGFKPEVLIIPGAELENIISLNPFNSFEGKTVHFYFCSQKPAINQQKLDSYMAASEEYELNGNVFYLHAPNGIGRSKLVSNVESCIGSSATGRNLNTVLKLLDMVKNA